jgi:hypothetical protein
VPLRGCREPEALSFAAPARGRGALVAYPVEAEKGDDHSVVGLIAQRWRGALTASTRRAYGFNVIFDKGSILRKTGEIMNILLIIVVVIAVVLLFTGGFVSSLNFLLWVGIVLLVLAVIGFLLRSISGRRA